MSVTPSKRQESGDEGSALADLAARIRELAEAAVRTRTGAAEAAAVADEIEALTARLSRREHDAPSAAGQGAADRHAVNPVIGVLNPFAPPVGLTASPDGVVRGEFTLGPLYEGPPAHVHGGMSAMVLDQALGTAAAAAGTPGMTATLEVRYRRPTPLGVPLSVEAKASRAEGRKVYATGTICDPDGRVTVEATGVFIRPEVWPPRQARPSRKDGDAEASRYS